MSLLPLILENWCADSRPLNRPFGVVLDMDSLLSPIHRQLQLIVNKSNKLDSDTTANEDKFQVNLDVQQFKPEEITVKVTGKNTITVEGKHEEKQDEHGNISRHFVRKFVLPDGHDIDNVASYLSSDGVLNITAPRSNQDEDKTRSIPTQQTGVSAKAVESNEQNKNESCRKG